MPAAQDLPTDDELRAWDWVAELERQERDVMWLARRTGIGYRSAYRRARGEVEPSIPWLRSVAWILGFDKVRAA